MSVPPPPGAPGPSPGPPSAEGRPPPDAGHDPSLAPARRAVLLRSFLIQGSWNYRTMLGGGFGFALVPLLRRLREGNEERLADDIRRHTEHFNAHPYLAPIALGAVARLEEEGEDPENIRRFKMAVRGPLGSLGDALVWAGWLPVTLLVGLILGFLGLGPATAVGAFLLLYNAGHILIRIWGFRMGFRNGRFVSDGIRSAGLARQIGRLAALGALLLGLLVALLVVDGAGTGRAPWPWLVASALTFLLGYGYGQRVRRAETYAFMLVISAFFLIGILI